MGRGIVNGCKTDGADHGPHGGLATSKDLTIRRCDGKHVKCNERYRASHAGRDSATRLDFLWVVCRGQDRRGVSDLRNQANASGICRDDYAARVFQRSFPSPASGNPSRSRADAGHLSWDWHDGESRHI
jgi:hypothetical protein